MPSLMSFNCTKFERNRAIHLGVIAMSVCHVMIYNIYSAASSLIPCYNMCYNLCSTVG